MEKRQKYYTSEEDVPAVARSADMFKKLSKCIKAYNKPLIQEAIDDVDQRIRDEKSAPMKRNLCDLVFLLRHKKEMLVQRAKLKVEKKPFPRMEVTVKEEIHRTDCKLKRKNKLTRQTYVDSFSMVQENIYSSTPQGNNKSEVSIAQTRAKIDTTKNRTRQSSQDKLMDPHKRNQLCEGKKALEQLRHKFSSNPKTVTPEKLQTYFRMKREVLDMSLGPPSEDLFKEFDRPSHVQVKAVPKPLSQLERFGTDIQHVLNECSEVLDTHCSNLGMSEDVQFVRKSKEPLRYRKTVGFRESNPSSSKGFLSTNGVLRAGTRNTFQQETKGRRFNSSIKWFLD